MRQPQVGSPNIELTQKERYELPESWVWASLGEIIELKSGKGLSARSRSSSGHIPVYGSNGIVGRHDKALTGSPVIVVGRKGSVGEVHISSAPCWPIDTTYFVDNFPNGLDATFLFRYLRSQRIRDLDRSTAVPGINREDLYRLPVPLPSLAEQRRIAAKIEALFEQSRTARQALDRIPSLLKKFRQSVLAAAFRGDLTRDWREQHLELDSAATLLRFPYGTRGRAKTRAGRLWGAGVVPELTDEERGSLPGLWTWTKVRNLGKDPEETVQVGPMSMRSRDFTDSGVPVLNVGCVQWGYFDETKLDHLPTHIAENFGRYRIAKDDILFTRSGTVGRCAIATEKQDGHLMTFHLLRVRITRRKCLPEYLQLVFQGAPSIRRQTDEAAIGSTRAGFNTNLLADLDVPLPPLPEQYGIVHRVERLFQLAGTIEQAVKVAHRKAEMLDQSVLARAFHGELVPQDPNDELASVLLDSIHADRTRSSATKRPTASHRRGKKSQNGNGVDHNRTN